MKGDRRETFESLCHEEYPSVVRAAYLVTGDRQEALDIAQESFARAYERWRTVSTLDRPGAWVQRVAINLAISWRRRQRVRAEKALPFVHAPMTDPEPADEELLAALRRLTPAQRAVIVLRYYADWSIEEVARTLGKRPGTVRALTSQGLATLRAFIPPNEVVHGSQV